MIREIEFRGKHIYTEEWYFGCLLEGEDNKVEFYFEKHKNK